MNKIASKRKIDQIEFPQRPLRVCIGNNASDNVVNDKNGANKNGSISPTDNLTEKELRIYQLVKENPEITTNGIADEMQVSIRTAQRYISMLRDKGFIVKAGNREQVKWIILK